MNTILNITTSGGSDFAKWIDDFANSGSSASDYTFSDESAKGFTVTDALGDIVVVRGNNISYFFNYPNPFPTQMGTVVAVDFTHYDGGNFTAASDPIAVNSFIQAAQQSSQAVINLFGNVSFTGNSGADIATLSSGNDVLNGKDGADNLIGNGGNDTLYGGAGDTLNGGANDDRFYVSNSAVQIVEAVNGGNDKLFSAVSYTLNPGAEVEGLYAQFATSTAALDLTGNEFGQLLQGSAGVNALNGMGGNDLLQGVGGNDTLTGGAGNDGFYFNTTLDAANNVDHITDFHNVAGDNDVMRLTQSVFAGLAKGYLSADAFYVGTAAHDDSDRIIYDDATGSLYFDADGNAANGVNQIKFAVIDDHASLTGNQAISNFDFIVA